ncbi:MAG: L-histidine N(alpha)-methyltransferase [Spirulina sp. SIO3F2]|nr:L-histidine N(alpha)-methyltransferase [Spirulina sp. SIO3F2]
MPSTIAQSRITIQNTLTLSDINGAPGADIIQGLSQTPKTLPPQYFYDEQGSILFEKICNLPEYYPTRTEASILRNFAHAIAHETGPCELIELGSGSSTKTRYLLSAYADLGQAFQYVPVDVSGEMLTQSAHQLIKEYPSLTVHGLVGTYEQAMAQLPTPPNTPRLMIFLGSTLGNFTPEQSDRFLAKIHASLRPGDYFLLGVDLQKSPEVLHAAYNDAQGVTAAFNLNMLTHLNCRFGSNFILENFKHRAVYNQDFGQIEMYLDCHTDQNVNFKTLNYQVNVCSGESIQTEISRKFKVDALTKNLAQHNLTLHQVWTDPQDWFALLLLQCV